MAGVGIWGLHATFGCSTFEDLRCVLVLMPEHVYMGSQVAILKHDLNIKQTPEVKLLRHSRNAWM